LKKLNIVLPKGRIFEKVVDLLNDAGYRVLLTGRNLRPRAENSDFIIKIMKPRNIPLLLSLGRHDIGFSGYDWIYETGVENQLKTLMDLEFNPVKIVAAIPNDLSVAQLKNKTIIVASEYEKISKNWLDKNDFTYKLLTVHGATEVYPPEDAHMIIDNTSTGSTLRDNNLKIIDTVMHSSTNFIACKKALTNPWKNEKINEIKMLFKSVLDARKKSILEMNIPQNKQFIIEKLPCLKSPTVMPLASNQGFAIKTIINKNQIAKLLPQLKQWGATDILEYDLKKVLL